MTTNDPSRFDPRTPEVAERLRRAADDELSASELERLRAERGADWQTDSQRIGFERSLRTAVGRVLESPASMPPDLRDRVEAALRAELAARVPEAPLAPDHAARIGGAPWVRWVGVAALLALAAGTVWIGLERSGLIGGAGGMEQVEALASYLEAAHLAGARPEPGAPVGDLAEAEAALREIGAKPGLLDASSAGYAFAGLTWSGVPVPGEDRSARIQFRPVGQVGGATVSLFVKRDAGGLVAPPGTTYLLEPRSHEDWPAMLLWRDGPVVCYLVAPTVASREALRDAFGAPEDEEPILAAGLGRIELKCD